jgi:hypothetical protein
MASNRVVHFEIPAHQPEALGPPRQVSVETSSHSHVASQFSQGRFMPPEAACSACAS